MLALSGSPGCESIEPRSTNRRSVKDRFENSRSGATALKSSRLSDTRIRTYGQVGVATFRVALEAQYSGQEGSGDYGVTTVWARTTGTWQMVAVQMTPVVK
jgi:Domain of unknown function (DUF4440)